MSTYKVKVAYTVIIEATVEVEGANAQDAQEAALEVPFDEAVTLVGGEWAETASAYVMTRARKVGKR